MMRVERLAVPDAKSCCSTSSVRRRACAQPRAMATPLMPPPITTTSKTSPSSDARWLADSIVKLDAQELWRVKTKARGHREQRDTQKQLRVRCTLNAVRLLRQDS